MKELLFSGLNSIFYTLVQLVDGWVGGGRVGGWVAIYLKSNHVPETLSFSKICSERLFSSCRIFFDIFFDGPTDRPTDKPSTRSSFPELRNYIIDF